MRFVIPFSLLLAACCEMPSAHVNDDAGSDGSSVTTCTGHCDGGAQCCDNKPDAATCDGCIDPANGSCVATGDACVDGVCDGMTCKQSCGCVDPTTGGCVATGDACAIGVCIAGMCVN